MITITSTIETAAMLYEQGNANEADAMCCEILKHEPNNANVLHLRGVIAYQAQNYADATKLLNKANTLTKNNTSIIFSLAASYENIQQFDLAASLYKQVCELSPQNLAARQQLASVLEKNLQLDEALFSYHILNDSAEKDPNVLLALARLYANSGFYKKAKPYIDEATLIPLPTCHFWNDLGLAYKAIKNEKKAISCFEKALSFNDKSAKKNHVKAHLNLASTLQDNGDFSLAKKHYLYVIESGKITPDELSRTYYNLALVYLGEGDFNKGWKNLARRPKTFTDTPVASELNNKRLLILGEEGLGDELLFLRFIPLLKKYDTTVDYIGNKKILPLLSKFDGINTLHEKIPASTDFDYCISVMDLPYILSITDVSLIPPVRLNANNATNDIIGEIGPMEKTLGITWRSGTSDNRENTEKTLKKNIPLNELCKAIKNFDGTLIVLQRNPSQDELIYLKKQFSGKIIDASSLNEDLNLMLSLLKKIDHYIGVSNTNMHLFGSLGKHCDVIIPFPGEWRWMWECKNSPWYSNFNLLRQASKDNWKSIHLNKPSYLTA